MLKLGETIRPLPPLYPPEVEKQREEILTLLAAHDAQMKRAMKPLVERWHRARAVADEDRRDRAREAEQDCFIDMEASLRLWQLSRETFVNVLVSLEMFARPRFEIIPA